LAPIQNSSDFAGFDVEVYLVKRAGDQEPAGTQERCAGMPVVDEAAHLWAAAKFLPSAGADPCSADDLAAAEPAGKGSRTGGQRIHAEG